MFKENMKLGDKVTVGVRRKSPEEIARIEAERERKEQGKKAEQPQAS
jgi:hypothetical protein